MPLKNKYLILIVCLLLSSCSQYRPNFTFRKDLSQNGQEFSICFEPEKKMVFTPSQRDPHQ